MNEEIKEKLDAEISNELDLLKDIEVSSEEYKTAVEGISKLIDRRNEIEKIDLERDKHRISERIETNKIDLERDKHHLSERIENNKISREKALSEHNEKDQLFKNLISVGSILIPVFVTIWGTYKTLKFEETGTVTTIMGRGFIGKLIPKK